VPEHGFSENNALLAKDRLSLDEKSIVAERLVKDAVRVEGSSQCCCHKRVNSVC
jgi:hypothetical protein